MPNIKVLDSFWLKIIALITMTIDHYGYFIEPNQIIFRIIGRLSFVIFAYFVANSYIYTSNKLKHGFTLLVYGLIIDAVLLVTNNYEFSNIFITLAFGYFIIYSFDTKKYYIAIIILVITYFIKIDYGYYGIVLILVCYFLYNDILMLLLVNGILISIVNVTGIQNISLIQYYSSFGIALLALYNGERGYKIKYLFYIYYPLHIIIFTTLANYI